MSIVSSQSKLKMLFRMLPKVPTGAHIDDPTVSYFPAKEIKVDSDPAAILEIDGDIFGTTPARFSVCPKAVQIVSAQWSEMIRKGELK